MPPPIGPITELEPKPPELKEENSTESTSSWPLVRKPKGHAKRERFRLHRLAKKEQKLNSLKSKADDSSESNAS